MHAHETFSCQVPSHCDRMFGVLQLHTRKRRTTHDHDGGMEKWPKTPRDMDIGDPSD